MTFKDGEFGSQRQQRWVYWKGFGNCSFKWNIAEHAVTADLHREQQLHHYIQARFNNLLSPAKHKSVGHCCQMDEFWAAGPKNDQ